jgi:WD40 repeat protein
MCILRIDEDVSSVPNRKEHGACAGEGTESVNRQVLRFGCLAGVVLTMAAPVSAQNRPTLVDQLGHRGTVWCVTFSPDGRFVATGSDDRTARLWDVTTGKETRLLEGHGAAVRQVIFSPTGKRLVTVDNNLDALRMFDTATGKLINSDWKGKVDKTFGKSFAVFSPDGRWLVTRIPNIQGTARVWDAETGKYISDFKSDDGRATILAVAFTGDGQGRLLVASDPARAVVPARKRMPQRGARAVELRLWDAAAGKEINRFRLPTSVPFFALAVRPIALSPSGNLVLVGLMDKTARLWDAATGNELHTLSGHHNGVESVAVSADGKRLLTGDGTMSQVWEADTGKLVRSTFEPKTWVSSGALSPDGSHVLETTTAKVENLIAGGGKVFVRLTEVTSGKVVWNLPLSDGSHAAAFSPDGKNVAVSDTNAVSNTFAARLLDTQTGAALRTLQGPGLGVTAVAVAQDGKRVATGGDDGTVSLWDLTRGVRSQLIRGHTLRASAVAYSPDGTRVLTGSQDTSAKVWDTTSGKLLSHFKQHNGSVLSVAFSPDGKLAATGGQDTVRIWDPVTGQQVRECSIAKPISTIDWVHGVAFAPNGKQLARGSDWSGATLWDVETGNRIATFDRKTNPAASTMMGLVATAYSPDGNNLATVDDAGRVFIWNIHNGKLRTWSRMGNAPGLLKIVSLAFAPMAPTVLTGSLDGAVELWSLNRPSRPIRRFDGHTASVSAVTFTPDGRLAVTGSQDTSTRLWDTTSGLEVCRLLSFRDGSWAVVTRENYYMASRGALQTLAFRVNDRTYSFEQFDLRFNRPDKVATAIGLAPQTVITAYDDAHKKRLKRMNFTEDMLADDFHVPEIEVTPSGTFATRDKMLKLSIRSSDSQYRVDRLFVDVNGVSVSGSAGIDLRTSGGNTATRDVDVELSAGMNKIDVSTLNEKGSESLRQSLSVQCEAPAAGPDLYVVAVGVSEYTNPRFRLTYADKDARDLAALLEGKRGRFRDVKIKHILNRDATRENIMKASDFLKPCGVDDAVVLFFAGHGLLDANLNYYFATTDIDFANPAERGLSYESVESLLDRIRARRKLLLMDTCHSGELDKEDVVVGSAERPTTGKITTRSFRSGLTADITPKVGLANSYHMLQDLFADLRRGTGGVVIASAGGAEYAVESPEWKNGVFTHAVIRGLKGEADRNQDGRVQVSELRDFVEQEVARLTEGHQTPTARSENVLFDFSFD